MALNSASCAANIYEAYKPAQMQQPTDYPAAFAAAYHNYASAGVIAGAVSGGGNASIIENFMRGVTSNTNTITEFAQALADYWATVGLTPAPPNLASVNNAASKVAAFEAALRASITDSDTQPYFKHFIDNIEAVAKTINWTITPPPPASPFVSNVV